MRRVALPTIVVALCLVTAAYAAIVTHNVDADFNVGNAFYDNVTSSNNDLRVETIDNVTGDWYRGNYDGTTWQMDLDKDTNASPWAADACLPIASNAWSSVQRSNVLGDEYRTGNANDGTSELGITDGTVIDMPGSNVRANEIRFLTHGGRFGDATYTVTVDRQSGSNLVYNVDILDSTTAARGGSGGTGLATWSTTGISGFTASAANTDCGGAGADLVVLDIPGSTDVVDITFSYPTDPGTPGTSAWLGGPIALSVDTTETEIVDNFTWRGTYRSSSQVGTTVSPPAAILDALWYQINWSGASFGASSEVELFVRCGSDTNGNGSMASSEWKDEDGGSSGAWQGPIVITGTGSTPMNLCTGTHLQYRTEFYPELATSPELGSLTFTYNPDRDGDGYPLDAIGGHPLADCDDNDATENHDNVDGDSNSSCGGDCDDFDNTIFFNAPVGPGDVGDGIDRDCDGLEECFLDFDQDGFGTEASTIIDDDGDGSCNQNDGESTNDNDCNDIENDAYPGNIFVPGHIGDGIDNDCNGFEECYRNNDNDLFGVNVVINESNDAGFLCEPADGEALPQALGFDCNDSRADIYPEAPITQIDIDDGLDSNCDAGSDDECWFDGDADGSGVLTFVETPNSTCDASDNESLTSDDCVDTNAQIYPGKVIGPADIDNNQDNNCSSGGIGDECYRDSDNDDHGTTAGPIPGTLQESSNTNCTDNLEATVADDCDDNDNQVYPGITIQSGMIEDGVDNDCNTFDECYRDNDRDTFGTSVIVDDDEDDGCNGPQQQSSVSNDCDDGDDTVYPGKSPLGASDVGNGFDNDCNGFEECYRDNDRDTYGVNTIIDDNGDGVCLTTNREDNDAGPFDCDDNNANANPGEIETYGNEIDENCNGVIGCYLDADGDGHGVPTQVDDNPINGTCAAIHNESVLADDCDDSRSDVSPSITLAQDSCGGIYGGDGIDNNCDGVGDDDDNDGLSFSVEQSFGTSDCEADTDNDGVDDLVEYNFDCNTNMAGIQRLNGTNSDTDGDGLSDGAEIGFGDDDNDGLRNACDDDDDGDGVPTQFETPNGNTDGDSLPDYRDPDDDNDGIPTLSEDLGPGDARGTNTDGDALPDYRDPDDDGDTIPTSYENALPDGDGDILPNYRDLDSDNDGVSDQHEWNENAPIRDTDGDGTDDFLDLDSDNDAVFDDDEEPPNTDTDGDGDENRIDVDDDGDGVLTIDEDPNGINGPIDDDTDGDGDADYIDNDDDGDGLLTAAEGTGDPDGDGEPNYLDLDSDGDTWSDQYEGASDQDGDGLGDFLDIDSDGDTVRDEDERGSDVSFVDTDNDGNENRKDNDDDGDGIPTRLEHADGTAPALDAPTNANFDGQGGPNYLDTDSDNDGWSDNHEWTTTTSGRDSDGDGARDFLDLDSDNDNVDDINEQGGSAPAISIALADDDSDNDGDENRIDPDDDNDNIPTIQEESQTQNGDPRDDNWDGDLLPDFLDNDDDNDNVLTVLEDYDGNPNNNPSSTDSDGDGIVNYLDTDDDNDGVDTIDEDVDGTGTAANDNTDGDQLPNPIDPDDDGDGIPTLIEISDPAPGPGGTPANQDADIQPNHLDTDSDADGVLDSHEWAEINSLIPGDRDYDDDGLNDYLDTDSDNDRVPDQFELPPNTDTDGSGFENRIDEDDDGDNVPTAEEEYNCANGGPTGCSGPIDLNPRNDDWDDDGTPNFLDDDDDGDNVVTLLEDLDGSLDPRNDDWDGDGIDNFLDTDDDNDSVPTVAEIDCAPGTDPNAPADSDTDGDGGASCTLIGQACGPNYLDTDDDDDTIPTITEAAEANADNDGCDNAIDTDSDNDDWTDEYEWNTTIAVNAGDPDFDGDGLPDFVDTDSDDDNVPDRFEGDSTTPLQTDSDALEDRIDTDDDGDQVPTAEEEYLCDGGTGEDPSSWGCTGNANGNPRNDDWDGDGVANYLDSDDDGDEVLTLDEDWDFDGDPRNNNTDGDSAWDFLDKDDDDDRVPTEFEDWQTPGDPFSTNTDEPDLGPDLIPRSGDEDPLNMFVAHGDDIPDYRDTDDDGDSLLTINEDRDGDGDPMNDNTDLMSGLPYCEPGQIIGCADDLPDFVDADDEGDGVPTWAELVFASGEYTLDTDSDGFLDGTEWINFLDPTRVAPEDYVDPIPCGDPLTGVTSGLTWGIPWDRDCDFAINALDIDDDGDGLGTGFFGSGGEIDADQDCIEGGFIAIGDGIPNWLDVDSDNETMQVSPGTHPSCPPTETEDCFLTTDGEESDGFDSDADGIVDAYDCDPSGPEGDSDLDGISNNAEGELCPVDPDGPGPLLRPGLENCPADYPFRGNPCANNPDSDCDGVLDCVEAGVPCPPLAVGQVAVFTLTNPPDTDGDGLPDLYDVDDENDSIPTADEVDFSCPAGFHASPSDIQLVETPLGPQFAFFCIDDASTAGEPILGIPLDPISQNTDAPGAFSPPFPLEPDAIPDYLDENDDGDERTTLEEADIDGDGVLDDDDSDGVVNHLDPNDFDGPTADADLDGISNEDEVNLGLNPYDDDSDDDGVPDLLEIGDLNNPTDTDGDSLIDALDTDDDDDGILTADEGIADIDGDGLGNHLDPDSDGDGILDEDENPGGDATLDADCDLVPNFLDANDEDGPCAVTGDTGGTGGTDGCGCEATGPSGAAWLFALATLAVTRRRRSSPLL